MLALTLAVGLLIDDAIVVIENIYRRMELGEKAWKEAAEKKGTTEIQMAVVAITLVVDRGVRPCGYDVGHYRSVPKTIWYDCGVLHGHQLVCSDDSHSYVDGYLFRGGEVKARQKSHGPENLYDKTLGRLVRGFDRFQTWLENICEKFSSCDSSPSIDHHWC